MSPEVSQTEQTAKAHGMCWHKTFPNQTLDSTRNTALSRGEKGAETEGRGEKSAETEGRGEKGTETEDQDNIY